MDDSGLFGWQEKGRRIKGHTPAHNSRGHWGRGLEEEGFRSTQPAHNSRGHIRQQTCSIKRPSQTGIAASWHVDGHWTNGNVAARSTTTPESSTWRQRIAREFRRTCGSTSLHIMELWRFGVTLTLPAQPLGNIWVAPMPRGTRSYMGLSVGYSCIVLRNMCLQHMIIAPLPMWSYVGLGLSRKCIIVIFM